MSALLLPTAACARGDDPHESARGTATQPEAARTSAIASSTIPPQAAPPAGEPPSPLAADPLEAPIASLRSLASTPYAGHFAATLAHADTAIEAELAVTLSGRPRHHRRAVALSRLAEALGLHLVAPAVLRPVGIGTLADLLKSEPAAIALLESRAVVTHDGTVDVLVRQRHPPGLRTLGPRSAELRRWAGWASAPEPPADEDPALTASYVALAVLDYLSASSVPGLVLYDEPRRELLLWENPSAFSEGQGEGALNDALAALRSIRRFPKELHAALAALDRDRARALFQPGAFETWLLPPRALIGLDERRAAVLTLIDARAAEPPRR